MKTSHLRVERILAWAVPACLILVSWVIWQSARNWAVTQETARVTKPSHFGQTRLRPCPAYVTTAAGSLPAGTLAIDFHRPFEEPFGLRLLPDGQLQRARGSVGYQMLPVPPPPPGMDDVRSEQGVYDWRAAWLDQPIVEQWWKSSRFLDVPAAWRTEAHLPPALAQRVSLSISRQLAWVEATLDEGWNLHEPVGVVVRQQGYCGLLGGASDEAMQVMAVVLFYYKTDYKQSEQTLAAMSTRLNRSSGPQPWLQMGADPAIPRAAEDSGLYGHRLPGRSPYRPPTAQEGSWRVQGWQPVTRQAGIAAGL